ncbi:ribonuclease HII [Clostridium sp.]|uniref:ribonuclease HII n=1 Tax=Clostridium sp. TaxID=1506 RepID=UPI003216DDD3
MKSKVVLDEIKTMRFNDIKSSVRGFMTLNDVANHEEEYELMYQTLNSDHRKNVKALGETVRKYVDHYKNEVVRVQKFYDFDRSYGYKIVAGVDEVGRGPLAGPIVAAAVVLDSNSKDLILRINDSKKLSKELREELSEIIKSEAVSYSIALKSNIDIDNKGIAFCNNEIFKEAINGLSVVPDIVLSDGYTIKEFNLKNEAVIKGDTKSASIACASIIAKVYRDSLMEEYSKNYSNYNFDKNVGYGTKEHMDAILQHGSCEIHRKSFLKNIHQR